MDYLCWHLNDSAVPYLEELTDDSYPAAITRKAKTALKDKGYSRDTKLRSWNWPSARAREILKTYDKPEAAEAAEP